MNCQTEKEYQAYMKAMREEEARLFDTETHKGVLNERKKIIIKLYKENEFRIVQHKNSDGYGVYKLAQPYEEENAMLVEWLGEIQNQIDNLNKGEK